MSIKTYNACKWIGLTSKKTNVGLGQKLSCRFGLLSCIFEQFYISHFYMAHSYSRLLSGWVHGRLDQFSNFFRLQIRFLKKNKKNPKASQNFCPRIKTLVIKISCICVKFLLAINLSCKLFNSQNSFAKRKRKTPDIDHGFLKPMFLIYSLH